MWRRTLQFKASLFGMFAIVWLSLPAQLIGQVDTGSISGTLRDSTGASIANATVTLVNKDTALTFSVRSGAAGDYTFSPVKIGHYSLTAETAGFQRVQQNNITVEVQQQVRVDVSLPLGETKETVVVNSAPPVLQTLDASVGQVIGAATVNALPLNGRNFTFLAQLSAGVTQGQQDTRGLGASGSFAANGLRPAQNNYLLDGIDNNTNSVDFLNGAAFAVRPPVDAIQEFKVETGNFSADLGRSAGAVLNATVKSGTNKFHGALWEFLRNDAFDAANYFEATKGKFRQNQFGFTFGGPLRHDKTFFFLDYEGTRIRQAIPYVSTVPTSLERTSGYTNLSELLGQGGVVTDVLGRDVPLGQVLDPATTRSVACGVPDTVTLIVPLCTSGNAPGTSIGFAREAFPGNLLPPNRLDPNAIKLLNLYPAPNAAGLFNNYLSNPVSDNRANSFDVRVDHTLGARDSAFGRISYLNNPQTIPGPFTGIADGGSFFDGIQSAVSWNAALSETHVFSPTFVNELRLGYNRLNASRVQPSSNTSGIPAQFGIQGVPQGDSNGGLGSIFITGLNTLGSNQFLPSFELSTTSQITDNVTHTIGRQTLKFGYQWERLGFSIVQPPSGRGTWSFSGLYTEVPTTTGGNTGLAQMLLSPMPHTVPGAADYVGGSDSVNASNIARTSMQHQYSAGYLQDDVKVNGRLTLNAGIRYEYFGQLLENYGNQSNFLLPGETGSSQSEFLLTAKRCNSQFSPDFTAAAAKDSVTIGCSGQPGLGVSQKTNFAPRLGFAYQLSATSVIRGGYGIFFGGFENSAVETYVDFPFQFNLHYSYLTPNAPIVFSNGAIGTLETGLSEVPLAAAAVEPGGVSFTGENYHLKTPYTQGYNLTWQFQPTRNDSLQIGYVGNTVRHLGVYTNPNSPHEILPPGLNPYLYSPYPDFTAITYTQFAADSNYNSLQTTYERRLAYGFSALANFTWAKCLTDAVDILNATSITGFRAAYLPGFGIKKDFGTCDYNVKDVFHFSGTYELPFGRDRIFGKGAGRVQQALIGGWNTNWILTLQDGQPGTVPCAITTTSGLGCNAFVVKGADLYGPHSVTQWLNPGAFTNPPVATTIGQGDYSPLGGGPSQFRGPGFHRLDFSLFKQFHPNERVMVEYRSEFFNILNHPNFSLPGFSGNGVVAAPGSLNYLNTTNFGTINSTRDGQNDQREIQFALKAYF